MDDLKLYSKNEQEQIGELKVVKQFSDDIGMEFGNAPKPVSRKVN